MSGARDRLWASEADLCAAFAETVPTGWTIYNETAGWDMVLVHGSGFQIGVEAKLRLNAKVLTQAADVSSWREEGPDCRAVLVGKRNPDFATLASLLGITVIEVLRQRAGIWSANTNRGKVWESSPELPNDTALDDHTIWGARNHWQDMPSARRLHLPDYVPDVRAGVSGPLLLSDWKIRAIKLCVVMAKRGYVTAADFKALRLSSSIWTQSHWLIKAETRGRWIPGSRWPEATFRSSHPDVFPQIEADFSKWASAASISADPSPTQVGLAL